MDGGRSARPRRTHRVARAVPPAPLRPAAALQEVRAHQGAGPAPAVRDAQAPAREPDRHRAGGLARDASADGPPAALGLFSVTGTIKALTHGFNIPSAVTLGSAGAVGGGVLASLLALEQPALLRWNRDLYALPALVGATSAALLHHIGLLNVATAVGAALFAFGLRVLALRYSWRTPRSHFWRNPFAGLRQQLPPPNPLPAPAPPSSVKDPVKDPMEDLMEDPMEDTVRLMRPDVSAFPSRRGGFPASARSSHPAPDPRLLLHRAEPED
ncbi:hypothetical protein GCM10010372_28670 [Streptomyces tauricus]|uniref:TRIC cation channel family protein n=1 Tax=Streptomyces tauricus TaxID=68274 RepID=UPI001676ADFA|nr:TRIC cation channel family protein [Streptomyces tauricus]GHA27106.1 hypothetical protein GCM10010372_28670 [Streptomyces tauricus]